MLKQVSLKETERILKEGGRLFDRFPSYLVEEKYIEYGKNGNQIERYHVVGYITIKNYNKLNKVMA